MKHLLQQHNLLYETLHCKRRTLSTLSTNTPQVFAFINIQPEWLYNMKWIFFLRWTVKKKEDKYWWQVYLLVKTWQDSLSSCRLHDSPLRSFPDTNRVVLVPKLIDHPTSTHNHVPATPGTTDRPSRGEIHEKKVSIRVTYTNSRLYCVTIWRTAVILCCINTDM